MAVHVSGIFCLHFCTVGGSRGRLSIFIYSLCIKYSTKYSWLMGNPPIIALIFHSKPQMTKVIRNCHLGAMNICTKFHGDLSKSCSAWTKVGGPTDINRSTAPGWLKIVLTYCQCILFVSFQSNYSVCRFNWTQHCWKLDAILLTEPEFWLRLGSMAGQLVNFHLGRRQAFTVSYLSSTFSAPFYPQHLLHSLSINLSAPFLPRL